MCIKAPAVKQRVLVLQINTHIFNRHRLPEHIPAGTSFRKKVKMRIRLPILRLKRQNWNREDRSIPETENPQRKDGACVKQKVGKARQGKGILKKNVKQCKGIYLMSKMSYDDVIKTINRENLDHYILFGEKSGTGGFSVVITKQISDIQAVLYPENASIQTEIAEIQEDVYIVFATDERASIIMETMECFDEESDALEYFIMKLRALNRALDKSGASAKAHKDALITAKDVKRILGRFRKNTQKEVIRIKTKISNGPLPLTASKFGGKPYIKDFSEYPRAEAASYPNGEKMMLTLLAQINFSDLPKNSVFPKEGLLQFFILNAEDTSEYRVIYHKDITAPQMRLPQYIPTSLMPYKKVVGEKEGRKITAEDVFWSGRGFPVYGEMALEFSFGTDKVNITENTFEEEFRKAAEELGIWLPEEFDTSYNFSSQKGNSLILCDECYDGGHKLLGHPSFTQADYREEEADVLLFQIDSAWSPSGETDNHNFIIIGDAGILRFMIPKKDLQNMDFSNVIYDWDCC